MEVLLGLLQTLTAAMTPTEFLITAIIVIGSVIFALKFAFKHVKAGGFLNGLVNRGNDEKIRLLTEHMEKSITKEQLAVEFSRFEAAISGMLTEIRRDAVAHNSEIGDNLTTLSMMRLDVEKTFSIIQMQIEAITSQMKLHDVHDEANFAEIKANIQRGQDLMNKVTSQLEKIDAFVQNAAPEFRQFHKELTREINQLSKDIGIMDHVLQAQINSSKLGITLR